LKWLKPTPYFFEEYTVSSPDAQDTRLMPEITPEGINPNTKTQKP
jgi:hypothetical protein